MYLKRTRTGRMVILCLLLCLFMTGCDNFSKTSPYQKTDFAMGTVISQNIYGGNEELAAEVLHIINDLENTISWRLENSQTAKINHAAGTGESVEISEKMLSWLTASREVYQTSGGMLDITIGPVARLWDIGGENPKIPEEKQLKKALKKVGSQKLVIEENSVIYTQDGGQIDLGAVGKGIGCDEIASYIEENHSQISGTFSVGGSVLIYGEKPNGQPWKIGIRNPRGQEGEYMGAIVISQEKEEKICVSTSGDYEKYFEKDGKRYHHILDPKTGAPAESDLISVTIISESGFLTDALSTACFVAGSREGKMLAEKFGAEAILITKENNVILTAGAEEYFEILDKEFK